MIKEFFRKLDYKYSFVAFIILWGVCSIGITLAGIYVIAHFVMKYW